MSPPRRLERRDCREAVPLATLALLPHAAALFAAFVAAFVLYG